MEPPREQDPPTPFRSVPRALAAELRGSPVRVLVAIGLSLVVAVLLATHPAVFGGGLEKGMTALRRANVDFFWVAGACVVASLIASANTWRTALQACGARVGVRDACARYGIGSLVNSFTPLRLGEAARIVLFSRTLPQGEARALTTGGALGAVEVARVLVQTLLVGVAAAVGALPIWPIAVLVAIAAFGLLAAFALRSRLRWSRVAHLLDAFRGLVHSPRLAVTLLSWTATAAIARVVAATAIASAFGVPWSLGTGLIITAALDLAAVVPLTPGNLGVATGAVALVLQARGVPAATAAGAGLAFNAVEVLASLALGGAGALVLAPFPSPAVRQRVLGLAGAAGTLVLVGGFGASVLPGLV